MSAITEHDPSILTLALALEWLKAAPVEDTEKRELRSAVTTACRWFRKEPQDVPADPAALRRLFGRVSAGGEDVTKKRVANVKWGVGRLLDQMGVGSRSRRRCPLSAGWRRIVETIEDKYARVLLARFGRYCSARKIEPEDVSETIAAEFLTSLEAELRVAHPQRVHRETIRLWNRNAATNERWPQQVFALPSYSRAYVLPWSAFHPGLVADVERYLSRQVTTDPFDLSAPVEALEPSTIATYWDRLRRFASCLVLTGTDPCQLVSLSDLVEMEAVVRGLRYLANERSAARLAGAIGSLLAVIARDHLGRPDSEVAAIAEIARRLRKKRKGLTSKVRERLFPLKHEPNLARLFLLPGALTRSLVRKSDPEIGDARLFQCALALALLTVCPLRIGALCSIRIDRHLSWSAGPIKGDLIIEFAEGELKGDEPASFPTPKEVADLIRVFCKRFRPLLNPCGSPFLFSGEDPHRPRCKNGFSIRLTRLIFDRLGLWVNPHLYRHIVHLVVLKRFPGAYAMVARVLTHRSLDTTIKNYSPYDGELAMRAYQRLVEGIKVGGPHAHDPDPDGVAYTFGREDRSHVGR